jgi:UV DNA damage endonuclease
MIMNHINLGYACINTHLQETEGIQCNRGMIKRTFLSRGLPYASTLALSNVKALKRVIQWNNDKGISVYRMTSCLFPWFSEYDIFDLPDIEEIVGVMEEAGKIAISAGQRLSFHPGPFNCLASPTESVVIKAIKELDDHSTQMDLMGLPRSHAAKINIHVGGAYGDRESALSRFCSVFERLSPGTQSRLTVENDDKAALYSTKMLVEGVSDRIGIPVVFDSHHHELGPQDFDYHDAFYYARQTWHRVGVKQQCHHSNSRKNYEDPKVPATSHSDWYYTPFESYGENVDVVLECKKKEQALFKYINDFNKYDLLVA